MFSNDSSSPNIKTSSQTQQTHQQKHRATVFDLSSQGWGVCKTEEGKIVFVPGTWLGDEIEFEVLKTGKFFLGRVLNWISKSPAHRSDPCPYSGHSSKHCGGCSWGGINYADQISAKNLKVAKALERHHINFLQVAPTQASSSEYAYRNRITLHKKNNLIGLKASQSNDIIPIEKCLVCTPELNKQIKATYANIATLQSAVDEYDILLQEAQHKAFMQGNSSQNSTMKTYLSSLLSNSNNPQIMIELFSGDGNFTEIFKTYTRKIYCYENGEDAVSRLQKRKLDGVTAKNIDLYSKESIHKILRDCDNADTLALDPPRSGFKELGILADELKNLKRIIYISCDLMTFCRDVASLSKKWTRKKLATFDMFPQTPHVELIAFIERD